MVLTKYAPEEAFVQKHVHTYICDVSDWKAVEKVAARVQREVSSLMLFFPWSG